MTARPADIARKLARCLTFRVSAEELAATDRSNLIAGLVRLGFLPEDYRYVRPYSASIDDAWVSYCEVFVTRKYSEKSGWSSAGSD